MTTVTGPYPAAEYARTPPVKGVPVQLDRERRLYYNMNAWRRLKKTCGLNIFEFGTDDDALRKALADPDQVTALIWAGLLHEDADLTLDDVGAWVDMQNLGQVTKAFMAALGDQNTGEIAADPTRATPSVGDDSTS